VLDSTFATNNTANGWPGGAIALLRATGLIENSILWGDQNNSISGYSSAVTVRTSCLPDAYLYPAAGNISGNPAFVDIDGGNLRLKSGSPCIDHGNNYADYDPSVPGFQLLPATDLDGHWRIVKGNKDGTATVDMGAYEYQGD
jgi:hypothetical protein